ncbi:hypothetical protein [Nevskia soli]|uniref:hypothetical protein n=1 Tax=Nevskia soli TaxID=418856 RepID=UPI0015D7C4DB|nr:hypothetical protein [Nevskia soli]
MKTILSLIAAVALCLAPAFAPDASAQVNVLTSTTTSQAILATDSTVTLTATTGVTVAGIGVQGSQLYVIAPGYPRGETMQVKSLTGSVVTVIRGRSGIRAGFPSGSTVLIGSPNWFYAYDPSGSCVTANVYVSPWVNTLTGSESLCSSVTLSWVPSWNSPYGDSFAPTAAVASAAGLITPSGPLFHVTGTAAITGFNIPVGFTGGAFTVIPDGIWTTTTANNIALASTSVVSKPITFTYDFNTAKFYPSY